MNDHLRHCLSFGTLWFAVTVAGGCDNNICESRHYAFVVAERFVKGRLKAPATADFGSILESEVRYLGDCTHEIRGFVDAENSFGGKMRTRYYVKVRNVKGTDDFDLLDMTIDGD